MRWWAALVLAVACGSEDAAGPATDAGADTGPPIDGGAGGSGGASGSGGDASVPDAPEDAGATISVSHPRELRGAWVATVFQLDWPSGYGLTADAQRSEMVAILDTLAALRMNAVFFQIRPESDAMYASTLEPWSRFLSGTQGEDPGWDPLAELVTEAHARSIEVHAWINPYRGLASASVATAPNHVTQTLSQHAIAYNGMVFMDPGAEAVREHVIDVVRDVVTRYDVDGIHFDDYFYPYPDSAGTDFPDDASWNAYQGALAKDDWRRNNVNLLVSGVAAAIAQIDPAVRFGISPFGIYRPGMPPGIQGLDAYATIYCDPVEWVNQGWVDYLAPQLYWPTTQTAQAYGKLLPWWATTCDGKAWVFAGNAISKLGTSSAWTLDELRDQITITRQNRDIGALGNVFFRMQMLSDDLDGIATLLSSELYLTPALPPPLISESNSVTAPPFLGATGSTVTITHPLPQSLRSWTIYRDAGASYVLDRIVPASEPSVTLATGRWAIAAVARTDVESAGRVIEIP